MKERIYICHTYYHVYVTILKELNLPEEKRGKATLVLSMMSNDFEQLKERLEMFCFFEEIIDFDEKREEFFPELAKYREDQGGLLKNMLARMKFTKAYGQLEEPYVPVDLKQYKDIYVFCDSDPIGYYLNYKRIYYHAVEDGLDTIKHFDDARYDNRDHFGLKAFLSSLNLIFIQNGYAKYCIDMEVNDISCLTYPCKKYIEVPRKKLAEALTVSQKEFLLQVFVKDIERLQAQLRSGGAAQQKVLILTEPLSTLEVRQQIFKDLIRQYEQEGQVYLKRHPRDELNYEELFPNHITIDGTVPMEMLNFIPEAHFQKVISVFTEIDAIGYADEKLRLGNDFMDKYEEPQIHRRNEVAYGHFKEDE